MKTSFKVGLFFIIATIITLVLVFSFQKDFSVEKWQNEPQKRYQMIDDILESKRFMNQTKKEIIELLGQPNQVNQERFLYDLGQPESFFNSKSEILVLYFKNDKVNKVTTAFQQ